MFRLLELVLTKFCCKHSKLVELPSFQAISDTLFAFISVYYPEGTNPKDY